MLRFNLFAILLILALFIAVVTPVPYDIYQILSPRFRRARLASFDGGETQYLQHLLQNLKPRFRRSI